MKPQLSDSRFETNITALRHDFTIKMSPHIAKLLSSQTYTDKLLAAIREPLSNAYDSHVRANTLDTPIDLHLPTQLEPHFALRDYGTGLSHDDVVRYFMSYGDSDKWDHANEIGGLGIGAKSFYSYSDIATVTSYYNGQKRLYALSKSEEGLPQGMLIHFENTDQPNGIELSYPVQPQDIESFTHKTVSVLTYLDLKVNSNVTLNIKKPQEFFAADIGNARVVLTINGDSPAVVMGGIKYMVPPDVVYNHARKLTGNTLVLSALIYLPIGSVEISASRESLSPTEQDKDLIVRILAEFQERLRSEDWDQRIADAPNWISAVQLRQEVHGVLGGNVAYKNGQHVSMREVLMWRGVRTWGAFESTDPANIHVTVIERKSRRSDHTYKTTEYASGYALKTPTRVFWMPKNKKIGWRNWYAENRRMDYYSTEHDLFIYAPTIEQARETAEFIGLTQTIEDGTTLQAPRAKSSSRSYNPRPQGQAWIALPGCCRQVDQLDQYDEAQLILTTSDTQFDAVREKCTVAWQQGLLTVKPVVFKPYGLSEASSIKRYGHLPQTFGEWVVMNPHYLDQGKILDQSRMKVLRDSWKSDWVRFDIIRGDEDVLRFPFPLHFTPAEETGLLDPDADASDLIAQVQNWHDTHVARMPGVLREQLYQCQWISWQKLFCVYNATLELAAT